MDTLTLKLTSSSALLMHCDRFANPLDPLTKAHKLLTSKRKKCDEDHEAIAKSEWRGSLYWSESTGPYLPTANVRSCLVEAGRLTKMGKQLERGTLLLADKSPLIYKGPRKPEELWADGRFYDCRSVVISGRRIMRYRPMFLDWGLEIDISYDPGLLNREDLLQIATTAGNLIGIGDFRPNKGGTFGRFDVEVKA